MCGVQRRSRSARRILLSRVSVCSTVITNGLVVSSMHNASTICDANRDCDAVCMCVCGVQRLTFNIISMDFQVVKSYFPWIYTPIRLIAITIAKQLIAHLHLSDILLL